MSADFFFIHLGSMYWSRVFSYLPMSCPDIDIIGYIFARILKNSMLRKKFLNLVSARLLNPNTNVIP